jgi:hypothetical protein
VPRLPKSHPHTAAVVVDELDAWSDGTALGLKPPSLDPP